MTRGCTFSNVKWDTSLATTSDNLGSWVQSSVNICLEMTKLTFSFTTENTLKGVRKSSNICQICWLVKGTSSLLNKTVLLRDRKRRTARAPPPHLQKFPKCLSNFVSKMFVQFCVQNFVHFLSKTLSFFCPFFCWRGGTPGGAPQLGGGGYPRGRPPQLGGGPPVDRQTENITFPSYSVCGR